MKAKKKKKSTPKKEPLRRGEIHISTDDPTCPAITIVSGKACIMLEILDGRPGFKMFDSKGVERFALYVTDGAAVIQLRTSDGRAVNHVIE